MKNLETLNIVIHFDNRSEDFKKEMFNEIMESLGIYKDSLKEHKFNYLTGEESMSYCMHYVK